jgi:hypothetical protein
VKLLIREGKETMERAMGHWVARCIAVRHRGGGARTLALSDRLRHPMLPVGATRTKAIRI